MSPYASVANIAGVCTKHKIRSASHTRGPDKLDRKQGAALGMQATHSSK